MKLIEKRFKNCKLFEIITEILAIVIGLCLYFIVHVALKKDYFKIAPWILVGVGVLSLIFSLIFTRLEYYQIEEWQICVLVCSNQREIYVNGEQKARKNDYFGFLNTSFVIELNNNVCVNIKASLFQTEVKIDGQLCKAKSCKKF